MTVFIGAIFLTNHWYKVNPKILPIKASMEILQNTWQLITCKMSHLASIWYWFEKRRKKKGISRKRAPDVYTQEIYKNSGLPGMETVKAWVMKAVPCDGLKVCVPLNWYVKALTSNVMVLGGDEV